MELLVLQGLMGVKEARDHLELLDLKEALALQDLKEILDNKDLRELLDQLELMALQVHLGQTVNQDLLVNLVLLEYLGFKEPRVK